VPLDPFLKGGACGARAGQYSGLIPDPNQRIKIIWHFGFKSHLLAAGGVFEGNQFGMKR
jgi:hypothetical protein